MEVLDIGDRKLAGWNERRAQAISQKRVSAGSILPTKNRELIHSKKIFRQKNQC